MNTRWVLDTAHSAVHFTVRHMMFSKVRGSFTRFSGALEFDPDAPESLSASARIEAASVDTREPKRDDHLRSADFFDADNHPELSFRTRAGKRDADGTYRLAGDLTIRGVTRPIELTVEYLGTGKDPWGNARVGFSATASVQRKEFGLMWNQVLEAGGVLVGDTVEIALDVQAIPA